MKKWMVAAALLSALALFSFWAYDYGKDSGYTDGYKTGYECGKQETDEWWVAEYDRRKDSIIQSGYEDGFKDGGREGYSEGYHDGYADGFYDGEAYANGTLDMDSGYIPK